MIPEYMYSDEDMIDNLIEKCTQTFNVDRDEINVLCELIAFEYFISDIDEHDDLSREELISLCYHLMEDDERSEFMFEVFLYRAAMELYGTEEENDRCNNIVDYAVEIMRKRKRPEIKIPG